MSSHLQPASEGRFLRACRREPVDATPIWLMRQAGRYMPEYRAMHDRYTILQMIKTPELACEVTLQPVKAFELDAAIIFADILPPLEGMGLPLEFVKGEGPVIAAPVRTAAAIDALRVTAPEESLGFTLQAIALARRELDGMRGSPDGACLPLIGFSGAPFTLASYAVEGGSSRNHVRTKAMMMGEPGLWAQLMGKLSEVVGNYLLAQASAGAQALQLFDSWAGQLSPADYRAFAMPYTQRALEIARKAGVPVIHFGTDTAGMLPLIREAGGDVIGVDWRVDLAEAWTRLGEGVAIQGNLDPVALFAPWPSLEQRARQVLDAARSTARLGHVFNLGHGVLPETPVDNVRRLVEFVHRYSAAEGTLYAGGAL